MRRNNSVLLILIIIFLLFCSQNFKGYQPPKPKYGGVLKIKSFSDTFRVMLDPTHPQSFRFISEQLFDNLVKLDKNLNIIPCLADYWKISEDGKIYTFYLKKGVRFHHGKELTADDVVFSFKRLILKRPISAYSRIFISKVKGALDFLSGKEPDIKGLKSKGKYIFEIEWEVPFVSALYLFSMPEWKILPMDLLKKKGKDFFLKPSGTGPFMFDYWIRDTRLNIVGIRLKRNENYFLGKPYLKAIEFCPLYTLDNFLNGEIDVIPVLSEKLLKGNYSVFGIDRLSYTYIGFSCKRAPFDKKAIREVISKSIKKELITNLFYKVHTIPKITNNYIPAQLPGFLPKENNKVISPEEAKRIWEKINSNDNLTVNLFLHEKERNIARKIYNELKNQLDFLNIKLKLKFYNSKRDILNTKKPYIIIVSYDMDFPEPENIVEPLFYTNSNYNFFEFTNSELDNLVKKAEIEKSWTRRIEIFNKIEEILENEVPAIPLFYVQQRIAFQNYVYGIDASPLGFGTMDTTKIWLNK